MFEFPWPLWRDKALICSLLCADRDDEILHMHACTLINTHTAAHACVATVFHSMEMEAKKVEKRLLFIFSLAKKISHFYTWMELLCV